MANLLSATASSPIPPPPDGAPPSYLIPLTLTRSDLEPETARAEDDHLINVAAAHIVQQVVAKALNVVNGDLATVLFAESNVAKAQLAVCNTVSAGDGIEATALTIDMDSVSEDDILRDVSLEMECTTSERNMDIDISFEDQVHQLFSSDIDEDLRIIVDETGTEEVKTFNNNLGSRTLKTVDMTGVERNSHENKSRLTEQLKVLFTMSPHEVNKQAANTLANSEKTLLLWWLGNLNVPASLET